MPNCCIGKFGGESMTLLYLGILLFGGSHFFSEMFPAVRNRLQARLGEQSYKGTYSIISLVGLVLLGWGYVQTRNNGVLLYEPVAGAAHVTLLLVLIGFVLISSFHGKGYIRKFVQNPFSWGVLLWSLGHLLANGKVAVVLIYGLLFVISVVDIAVNMARGNRPVYEPRIRSDIIAVVAGVVIYLLAGLVFHPYVLGVPVLQ